MLDGYGKTQLHISKQGVYEVGEMTQFHKNIFVSVAVIMLLLIYSEANSLIQAGPDDEIEIPISYVIVIDTSASMRQPPVVLWPRVKSALSELVTMLRPGDVVTFLQFDEEASQILDENGQPIVFRVSGEISQRDLILSALDRLTPNGRWTYFTPAIEKSYEVLNEIRRTTGQDSIPVIIMISDGKSEPPPGREENLTPQLIGTLKEEFSFEYGVNLYLLHIFDEETSEDIEDRRWLVDSISRTGGETITTGRDISVESLKQELVLIIAKSHMPDLIISKINGLRDSSREDTLNIEILVGNQGVVNVNTEFQVGIFLSHDGLINMAEDIRLGNGELNSIIRGRPSPLSFQFTIPPNIDFKTYHLIALADINEAIDEANEKNNVIAKSFSVRAVDLIVDSVGIKGKQPEYYFILGNRYIAEITVKNVIHVSINKNFKIDIYLIAKSEMLESVEQSIENQSSIASLDVPGIAAGAATRIEIPLAVPRSIDIGKYKLIAEVDSQKVIEELAQENNNTRLIDVDVREAPPPWWEELLKWMIANWFLITLIVGVIVVLLMLMLLKRAWDERPSPLSQSLVLSISQSGKPGEKEFPLELAQEETLTFGTRGDVVINNLDDHDEQNWIVAQLQRTRRGFSLLPESSSVLISVNGESVENARIVNPGDSISIGKTNITIYEGETIDIDYRDDFELEEELEKNEKQERDLSDDSNGEAW